eukprot:GHVS01029992.1.p1 GENE.GHVS01029992.1~~GHVS01029992.1.p1  ORF type:complete len:201 (+),score=64.11 GHVS01029992.1:306-908(+)
MNLQEVFKKIEMALTPQDATPEVQEVNEEVKVEMATMKLAGGVVVEAESFEAGENVFLLGEDDEKVAAPVGEHELEDGRILVIVEEGVIAEIREAGEEVVEEVVEEEESTEMAQEEMAYVTKEEFGAAIDELKEMIAAMLPKEEEMAAEEVNEEKVEMSADEAPAAKKVAAAPVDKKPDMVQFSKKAGGTTLSRVMSKLS